VSEKLVKNFLSALSLNLILIENSRYVVHNVVHNCVQCKQVQMAFFTALICWLQLTVNLLSDQ